MNNRTAQERFNLLDLLRRCSMSKRERRPIDSKTEITCFVLLT